MPAPTPHLCPSSAGHDGKALDPRDHGVAFYDDAGWVAESVASHLGPPLAAGQAAVVIATPDHRAAVRAALARRGVDGAAAALEGQLVELDAAATLAAISDASGVRSDLLQREVGAVLATLAATRGGVCAFGEMVDLLAARGAFAEALRLEAGWEELIRAHGVSLLCSYRLGAFDDDADGDHLRDVCAAHGHVAPLAAAATAPGEAKPDA